MEFTAEKAVAITFEMYGGCSAKSMAWWIIVVVGRQFSPAEYLPFVPSDVQDALRVRSSNPPQSIDDLLYAESSVRSSEFFEGLTPQEAEVKIREEERSSKQETFDAIHALHAYFASA